MSNRNKWFFGALVAAVVLAAIVSGQPAILVQFGVLILILWIAIRIFIFVRNLLSPVRKAIEPVSRHINTSLRKSGMGSVADAIQKVESGIDCAANSVEKGIRERSR